MARQIEGTQFGTIQVAVMSAEFFVGVDERFEVLAAPGLADSMEHAQRIAADGEVLKLMLGLGVDKGCAAWASLHIRRPPSFRKHRSVIWLTSRGGKSELSHRNSKLQCSIAYSESDGTTAMPKPDLASSIMVWGAALCKSILNVIRAPKMTIMPHDHRMWAVIGLYTGREDNIFWRRVPGDRSGKVEAAGARSLCVGNAEPLGHNIIHSVTNPIPRLTGAIHVHGGDFFAAERSEWDPESLLEERFDPEQAVRRFEEANT